MNIHHKITFINSVSIVKLMVFSALLLAMSVYVRIVYRWVSPLPNGFTLDVHCESRKFSVVPRKTVLELVIFSVLVQILVYLSKYFTQLFLKFPYNTDQVIRRLC